MMMYRKKISNTQKQYAQYYNALHYEGAIPIFDTEVFLHEYGFSMEFSIKPTAASRTYRALIVYVYGYKPYSYIVAPNLVEISTDRIIPHLYSQSDQRLCLTYPAFHEWTTNQLMVDSYIPWIVLWLFYYEGWILSDKWEGGGIHPGEEPDIGKLDSSRSKKKSNTRPSAKKRPDPLTIANNIYYGRKKKYKNSLKKA